MLYDVRSHKAFRFPWTTKYVILYIIYNNIVTWFLSLIHRVTCTLLSRTRVAVPEEASTVPASVEFAAEATYSSSHTRAWRTRWSCITPCPAWWKKLRWVIAFRSINYCFYRDLSPLYLYNHNYNITRTCSVLFWYYERGLQQLCTAGVRRHALYRRGEGWTGRRRLIIGCF